MKVFFADGAWSVAQGNYPELGHAGAWSGIAHKCGWFKKKRFTPASHIRTEDNPRCAKCHDLIPLTLVGLWKMHNWDAIQEWESDKAKQEAMYKKMAGTSFYGHNVIARPEQGAPSFYAQPWPETPTKCPQ